jgi:hypothetical protein
LGSTDKREICQDDVASKKYIPIIETVILTSLTPHAFNLDDGSRKFIHFGFLDTYKVIMIETLIG